MGVAAFLRMAGMPSVCGENLQGAVYPFFTEGQQEWYNTYIEADYYNLPGNVKEERIDGRRQVGRGIVCDRRKELARWRAGGSESIFILKEECRGLGFGIKRCTLPESWD